MKQNRTKSPRSGRVACWLLALLCGAGAVLSGCEKPVPFDLLVENGTVIDGTGKARYRADIAIRAGRIAEIGVLAGSPARQKIDATGLIIAPGFIDLHNLSTRGLQADHAAARLIRQGITSALLNTDAGLTEEVWPVAAYLYQFELRPAAVNVGVLIAHQTIRRLAMQQGGLERPATEAEIELMKVLIGRAMRDGALGFASSLSFGAGRFARPGELAALAQKVESDAGLFVLEARNPLTDFQTALQEAASLAGGFAGRDVHLSNAHFILSQMQRRPETALPDNVYFHVPPFASWFGEITKLVPQGEIFNWRLIRRAIHAAGGAGNIRILRWPSHTDYEGFTLLQIARAEKISPQRAYMQIVKDPALIAEIRLMKKTAFADVLASNKSIVVSQGGLDIDCPQSFAAFPHFLAAVRDRLLPLTLEKAVAKISRIPAERLGLQGRGMLQPAAAADLVIFDVQQLGMHKTKDRLDPEPTGIRTVLVNGKIVLQDGQLTRERPGVVLRHPGPEPLRPEHSVPRK